MVRFVCRKAAEIELAAVVTDGSFYSTMGVQSCQGPFIFLEVPKKMYQALYRKWRPKTFDDVSGQSHITDTLKKQVSTDRLSHAYLFIGTRGTGKTSCAKILAKAVNCLAPTDGNPCNACPSCLGIDDGSVMDVVEMDAASNNGVDNVRALRDEAVFSPAMSKKRVYIVDEVHMLSNAAFNALLKILEEPPAHLMFILATTELQKVPATILSRCQRHSFKRLDADSIIARLKLVSASENISLEDDAAALIARLSEGGMRDALSLLDQCSGRDVISAETVNNALGLAGARSTVTLLGHICDKNAQQTLLTFEDLWKNGKDPAILLSELSSLVRDILICVVAPKNSSLLQSGAFDGAALARFARILPSSVLVWQLETLQKAMTDIKSGQAKIICELCLITLCEPGDSLSLLSRIAGLEKRLDEDSFTLSPKPLSQPSAPSLDAVPKPEIPATDLRPQISEEISPDEIPFDIPDHSKKTEAAASEAPPPLEPEPKAPSAPEENSAQKAPTAIDSGAPPSSDAEGWDKIKAAAKGKLPIGLITILSNASQVSGSFSENILSLCLKSEFSKNMLGKPDVIAKLTEIARDALAPDAIVRIVDEEEQQTVSAPAEDKLDTLSKFDIVTFK